MTDNGKVSEINMNPKKFLCHHEFEPHQEEKGDGYLGHGEHWLECKKCHEIKDVQKWNIHYASDLGVRIIQEELQKIGLWDDYVNDKRLVGSYWHLEFRTEVSEIADSDEEAARRYVRTSLSAS